MGSKVIKIPIRERFIFLTGCSARWFARPYIFGSLDFCMGTFLRKNRSVDAYGSDQSCEKRPSFALQTIE
jgi:hypothetical protein